MGEMPSPLLWALAIVAFGALLIVCVLILLRRQPSESVAWAVGGATVTETGSHLQHLHRLLRAIRAINSVIVGERDRQRLMERACHALTTTRGYKMAWIGLAETDSKKVSPVASAGMDDGYLAQVNVTWDDGPTGDGPTGRAIKSGEPAVMRDIETGPEFHPWREEALQRGFHSSVALPLRCRGRVVGALSVYSDMPDAFDIEEVGLLQEVADHLAYALAAIDLEQKLSQAGRAVRLAGYVRDAYEHVPVGIFTTDRDGLITSINPAMLQLLQQEEKPEDVVDHAHVTDLGICRDPQACADARTALAEATAVTFGCRPVPGHDAPTHVCHAVPMLDADGRMTGTVWVVAPGAARAAREDGTT